MQRRIIAAALALCGLGAALAACVVVVLREGELCKTTAQCGPGLLCDTTQSPPICAGMLSRRPDLAGVDLSGMDLAQSPPDFAGVDLFGVDLSAAPPPDMTQLPDLTVQD